MTDTALVAAPDAAVMVEDAVLRFPGTPAPSVEAFSLRVPVGGGVVLTAPGAAALAAATRALTGLLKPFSGSVEVLGLAPDDPGLRGRVGYAPARRPFPGRLTVAEAALLVARLRGRGPDDAARALRAAGLEPGDRRQTGGLELGDVRRLALAVALVGDPELVVLDDPWEYPETVAALRAARARGATVVVASPDPGGFPDVVGPLVTLPGAPDEEEGV